MPSYSSQDGQQTSQMQWDPEIIKRSLGALSQFQGQVGTAQQGANTAAAGMKTDFGQAPTLQTNFNQYAGGLNNAAQLGGPLDSRSQQQLGAVRGERAAQGQAQAAQLGRSLDPRVAAAVSAQGRNAMALAGNADRLNAGVAQDARMGAQQQMDAQRAQVLTGLGQAGNQAQLQGTEARTALQTAGNNALAQRAQTQAAPASLWQGLLAALGQFGQGTGKQVTNSSGSAVKL
jgi:hypothetical protein